MQCYRRTPPNATADVSKAAIRVRSLRYRHINCRASVTDSLIQTVTSCKCQSRQPLRRSTFTVWASMSYEMEIPAMTKIKIRPSPRRRTTQGQRKLTLQEPALDLARRTRTGSGRFYSFAFGFSGHALALKSTHQRIAVAASDCFKSYVEAAICSTLALPSIGCQC